TAGALAILLALGAGVFAIGSALLPIRSGDATGETPPPAETAPPEGDGSAIDWPANMATGGIIFGSTGGSIEPQRSAPLTQGTAPAVPEVTRDDGKNDVLLYVDYRCPYCMHFEEQNSALLEAAMQTGNTTVEVVPLTFLDRASNGSYYSSRAAGAVACLVDQQPELAWKAHVALLSSKLQPEEGISGPDNAQLISELEGAVGGLNAKAKDCITTERFVPFAQALSNWVFANTIPNAKDATLRVEGTPTALVNGVPYTGDPTDGAAFRAFFEEQTK
ncbi:MAG: DsbA family protein, partial [Actinobacteria bacterium]|nr:DsbA family protein [Actinomycetota bacterium]